MLNMIFLNSAMIYLALATHGSPGIISTKYIMFDITSHCIFNENYLSKI